MPGQTLILLLSFRRHDIFGIGLPIALHVNVTRIPSVARVSELLESSNISGGTTCLTKIFGKCYKGNYEMIM